MCKSCSSSRLISNTHFVGFAASKMSFLSLFISFLLCTALAPVPSNVEQICRSLARPLTRLWPARQTACGMMNGELISETQKRQPDTMAAQPDSLRGSAHISARLSARISSLLPFLILSCFYPSHSLTASLCLLLFLSSSALHGISAWAEELSFLAVISAPLTIASNKPPDDTCHYSKHCYVNTKESPKEESQFSRRRLRGTSSFLLCFCHNWRAAFGDDFGLFCFRACGPVGPWRNAYFPFPWISLT